MRSYSNANERAVAGPNTERYSVINSSCCVAMSVTVTLRTVSINKKTGKITVAKGLAKGAYKVTAKAKAAGNASYASGYKAATVTVKVK